MSDVAAKPPKAQTHAKTKGARTAPGAFPYVEIYRASPMDRIRIIKDGVPALRAKRMVADLSFDQRALLGALNLKTATVNRKASRGELLSADESERVIGIVRLVGQLEAMVEESGEAAGFQAHEWLSGWLRAPLPSLGGLKPFDLLDTMEGQSLVSQALSQIQSGAYA